MRVTDVCWDGEDRMNANGKRTPEPWRSRPEKAASIDQLVDRFVAAVNAGHREPASVEFDGIPPSVRVAELDEPGWYDWAIKPYAPIDWIDSVERRLPRRFPTVYRSLVARYIFPSFEAGDVAFLGNTPEGTDYYELRDRIFSDGLLSAALLHGGYIQIGNPAGVNYDPICFVPDRGNDDDRPLVRIDHEGILIHDELQVIKKIAPSLSHLMNLVIEATGLQPAAE
jgi:hypothetical protein